METEFEKNEAGIPPLDARLALTASFIRSGAVMADVGTDHAYLPIHLILSGVCPRAVASDIHAAPLERAREHADKFGVSDRITFCLADGVADIDLAAEGVTDIAVCGMGGEMIAGILAAAPYTRLPDIRCILQPMSSAVDLRQYLAAAGYRIEDEKLAEAAGKIYTCLAVTYDGVIRTPTPVELLLGAANIRRGTAAGSVYARYLQREYAAAQKKYNGRRAGGLDTAEEKALLTAIEKLLTGAGVSVPQNEKTEDLRHDRS